jgi:hypothetical protein
MKRCISILLLAVILLSLSACNFTKNMAGAMAGEAQATPKVEEMMSVLAQKRTEDAKALLHPEMADRSDAAIKQVMDYLNGRKATAMEMVSIQVNSSAGTSGVMRKENLAYKVTLQDSTVIYLNVIYLSDNSGDGFLSFQVVLGVAE